jgi:hypothetical protein
VVVVDNWEAFNAFNNFIFQIFTAGFVFGFGSRFRKPIWENPFLCVVILGGYLTFTIGLLSSENGLTKIFHFPQTNYNEHGTESTTWGFYQNVNEWGTPFFGDDAGCPYYAVDADHSWHHLYPTMDYCMLAKSTDDQNVVSWTTTHTVKAEGVATTQNDGCTRVDDSDEDVTITYIIPTTLTAADVTENLETDDDGNTNTLSWDIACTANFVYSNGTAADGVATVFNTKHDFNNAIDENELFFGLVSTTVGNGDYYPGTQADALAFDTCAGNACQVAHPGCDCGMEDGVPKRMDNAYDMDSSLRTSLFLIVFFNSGLSMLWIWQGVDGYGREAVKSEKPNYIKLDM